MGTRHPAHFPDRTAVSERRPGDPRRPGRGTRRPPLLTLTSGCLSSNSHPALMASAAPTSLLGARLLFLPFLGCLSVFPFSGSMRLRREMAGAKASPTRSLPGPPPAGAAARAPGTPPLFSPPLLSPPSADRPRPPGAATAPTGRSARGQRRYRPRRRPESRQLPTRRPRLRPLAKKKRKKMGRGRCQAAPPPRQLPTAPSPENADEKPGAEREPPPLPRL